MTESLKVGGQQIRLVKELSTVYDTHMGGDIK